MKLFGPKPRQYFEKLPEALQDMIACALRCRGLQPSPKMEIPWKVTFLAWFILIGCSVIITAIFSLIIIGLFFDPSTQAESCDSASASIEWFVENCGAKFPEGTPGNKALERSE